MSEKPIRVMVVDDHDMVRSGLEVMLEAHDDIEFVAQASSGPQAIKLCPHYQPDVVLMDLVMPGMNGVETTRAIKEICPDTQVVALTSFKERDLVEGALKAGAISYLLKNVSIDELAEAIRDAHLGRATLAREATDVLIKAATEPPQPGHDLTPREREVLGLLVHGMTNREIAESLTISRSTVKHHVSSILAKLQAHSRAEATAMAVQLELVN